MASVTNGAFIVSNCAQFDSAPTLIVVFPESPPPTSAGRLEHATHDGHLIVNFLQVFELLIKALHVFFDLARHARNCCSGSNWRILSFW